MTAHRLTKKHLKFAKELLASYKVKSWFGYTTINGETVGGYCVCEDSMVWVNTKHGYDKFWSTVFHELVHALCFRAKVYPMFHCKTKDYWKPEFLRYNLRHALKIEQWVDSKAAEIAKDWDIPFKYQYSYRTAKDIKWLRRLLDEEREYLKKLNKKRLQR
jgi:hypothetical protein